MSNKETAVFFFNSLHCVVLCCACVQAEVMGQTVTWLTPHQLTQVLPTDVDYKVGLLGF